jgi:hypothetical protein
MSEIPQVDHVETPLPVDASKNSLARWTEQTAQALTEGWMAHLGYTPDQIALTRSPRPHNRTDPDAGYHCDLTSEGSGCWDENGEPAHPIHDAADEIAEQVIWTLDALAAAFRAGETRTEWGTKPPIAYNSGAANLCFSEEQARELAAQDPSVGRVCRRFVTTFPDNSLLIGPWVEVPNA